MSSPSEPEEMTSTSLDLSFLPSRMTEPLPNWRSIWLSAADRAFDLSMDDPSTRRRGGGIMLRPYLASDSTPRQRNPCCAPGIDCMKHCTPFVLRSQYVLFGL